MQFLSRFGSRHRAGDKAHHGVYGEKMSRHYALSYWPYFHLSFDHFDNCFGRKSGSLLTPKWWISTVTSRRRPPPPDFTLHCRPRSNRKKVLATDLKEHFDVLGEFNSHLADVREGVLVNEGRSKTYTCAMKVPIRTVPMVPPAGAVHRLKT